ncbi:unnamed protein product [Caenorhabditis angaria]|uniref:Uncharacterized protein n=1 Tax=Caenorhabditis angaria TaxID=860376 RepID=A0A9P1J0I7_9PELO|nr:unnamed protein product [Caenorhabditis angaria]
MKTSVDWQVRILYWRCPYLRWYPFAWNDPIIKSSLITNIAQVLVEEKDSKEIGPCFSRFNQVEKILDDYIINNSNVNMEFWFSLKYTALNTRGFWKR